jgi:hypothetical protein
MSDSLNPEVSACGGCGRPLPDSPGWLCHGCSDRWEAAIQRQMGPAHAADWAERSSIARYRARRR